ncbi:hypothetical protein XA68_15978 [Ophiocordyceps unilateralis]|uniref:Uncharacterized protein n=1 Tax=Ophiocordyceps unilateralis TaxID=268505 RepID=A0A2A9P7C9_OPHUN|nr:hypothetical protein XA68_15978 [Ophiocordyceps unilateralis]
MPVRLACSSRRDSLTWNLQRPTANSTTGGAAGVTIVPDDQAGILVQASGAFVGPEDGLEGHDFHVSPDLRHLTPYQISMMPFPPLKSFDCSADEEFEARSCLWNRLDNLVDGMNLDASWACAVLGSYNPFYCDMLREVIALCRQLRKDGNHQYVTRAIPTLADDAYFRRIPGR